MSTPESNPIIHTPLLGNAKAHGYRPDALPISQLAVGEYVAVLAPGDGPHQIKVRVTAIETTRRFLDDPSIILPEILVGQIEPGETWGDFFRPGDPAYLPGALIRFGADNISELY